MVNDLSLTPCTQWIDQLAALHREDLSFADRVALTAHLMSCKRCAAIRNEYHVLREALRSLPPASPPPGLPQALLDIWEGQKQEEPSTFPESQPMQKVLIRIDVRWDARFTEVSPDASEEIELLIRKYMDQVLPELFGKSTGIRIKVEWSDQEQENDGTTPHRPVRVHLFRVESEQEQIHVAY
jgi:hypothetical protein